jgi:multicomponent Na+:H+ antiporter subunit B
MMEDKTILRVITKLVVPVIVLYAFYVQFHGDFGPGGGFQAGVIFATALIIYGLIFGVGVARRVIPAWVTRVMLSLGVLLYGGTGVVSMLMGGEFLDYSALAHEALHGQHWGIFAVEFGVGMTVAGAMITIFFTFAGHVKGETSSGEGD